MNENIPDAYTIIRGDVTAGNIVIAVFLVIFASLVLFVIPADNSVFTFPKTHYYYAAAAAVCFLIFLCVARIGKIRRICFTGNQSLATIHSKTPIPGGTIIQFSYSADDEVISKKTVARGNDKIMFFEASERFFVIVDPKNHNQVVIEGIWLCV